MHHDQQDFTDAIGKGPLAGILTLSNDIANDVRKDAAVKNATRQWTACMARNGYTYSQPQNVFFDQIQKMFGGKRQINLGATVSTAANQAQIAAAVTDATCTESADLAGIYFAVQASYEQQIVNANQQALTSAVQQYKAAYAKELKKLPSLLKTAKATAFPPARPTRKDNVRPRLGAAPRPRWKVNESGALPNRSGRTPQPLNLDDHHAGA